MSGAVAGLLNTAVVGPSELVKCKMQMQKKIVVHSSSYDCAKFIIKSEGFVGLFQGAVATAIREVPAYIC